MIIKAIKTRILLPPKDDLFSAFSAALGPLKEKTIVAIASKAVSIGEGRCIKKEAVSDKDALIRKEADFYVPRGTGKVHAMLTIKNNVLLPTAGIDESNADGYYILWPRDLKKSAQKILRWLRSTYGVRDCGVLLTDSRSLPLRRGVMGVALAWAGFSPLNDYRGKKDLFGRAFSMTQANVADALATAAVLAMGEGREQTPVALITDISFVRFGSSIPRSRRAYSSFEIKKEEDIYYPLFKNSRWKRGAGRRQ